MPATMAATIVTVTRLFCGVVTRCDVVFTLPQDGDSDNVFLRKREFALRILLCILGGLVVQSAPHMNRIVGIDLGTTNSLVATVDSGIPLVIADAAGRRLTPSVVHFPAAGAEAIVGHEANRVRVVKPAETVYSVKRFMGRRGADISRRKKCW